MNVRAIFIDMDGTLLKALNYISRRNMEAIFKLINRGVKVFLATGRHYEVTAPYHKEIGLQTPVICLGCSYRMKLKPFPSSNLYL